MLNVCQVLGPSYIRVKTVTIFTMHETTEVSRIQIVVNILFQASVVSMI